MDESVVSEGIYVAEILSDIITTTAYDETIIDHYTIPSQNSDQGKWFRPETMTTVGRDKVLLPAPMEDRYKMSH